VQTRVLAVAAALALTGAVLTAAPAQAADGVGCTYSLRTKPSGALIVTVNTTDPRAMGGRARIITGGPFPAKFVRHIDTMVSINLTHLAGPGVTVGRVDVWNKANAYLPICTLVLQA
jgi:hypothetical protein